MFNGFFSIKNPSFARDFLLKLSRPSLLIFVVPIARPSVLLWFVVLLRHTIVEQPLRDLSPADVLEEQRAAFEVFNSLGSDFLSTCCQKKCCIGFYTLNGFVLLQA